MDPKRLNETAESMLEIPDLEPGVSQMAECMYVLTSPEPLTLERAVAVMGREPGERIVFVHYTRVAWDEAGLVAVKQSHSGEVFARIGNIDRINPTVGQFACLVLAAKQGEKA